MRHDAEVSEVLSDLLSEVGFVELSPEKGHGIVDWVKCLQRYAWAILNEPLRRSVVGTLRGNKRRGSSIIEFGGRKWYPM